jgi:hypothetical protein
MRNRLTWSIAIAPLLLGLVGCTKENPVYCDDSGQCPDGGTCSVDKNICSDATFTLDRTPYYDDGTRLWTSRANPVLNGSTDQSKSTIEVVRDGQVIATAGEILNGQWQLQLPDGAIRETDTPLKIHLVGKDGTLEFPFTFTFDAKAATAAIAPISMLDESKDVVTFNPIGEPHHEHGGTPVVLAGSCPSTDPAIVKYGYLMDSAAPMYGTENQRNMMQWQVRVEARAAIDEAKTQMRISKTGVGVIADWMPVTPVKVDDHWTIASDINRQLTPMVGTDGDFQVEWEIVDWAGRKTVAQACWKQSVLAAPITNTASTLSPTPALVGLAGLSVLGSAPQLAALINETGNVYAFEQTLINATTEPVTFTASVVASTERTKISTLHKDNIIQVAGRVTCPGGGDFCLRDENDTIDADLAPITGAIDVVWTPALVDGAGLPLASCVATGQNQTQCTIPGRAVGGSPVVVRLVASTTLLPELNPSRSELVVARNGFVEIDTFAVLNRCGQFDSATRACILKRNYELHLRLTDASLTFANGSAGPDFDFVVPNGLHYARTPSPLALTWDGTP